jgi:branched-chain amino acid transport system ATP-binding protein
MNDVLEVRNLTLQFGGIVAVHDLTFDVHRGEFFAIIGPNGAGKTSLFNCLTGIYTPRGSVKVLGQEIVGRKPNEIARLGVARTFQNLGLFDSMTPLENILVGRDVKMTAGILAGALRWPARKSERAARIRAHEILDLMELNEYADTEVRALPYGIRKRIELAKAAVMDPELLLLDEPVAGMNREETEEIMGYVSLLREHLGLTIILIEHDIQLVMDLADRVLALDFGQMIGLGTPEDTQSNERVIEAYLGVPDEPMPAESRTVS